MRIAVADMILGTVLTPELIDKQAIEQGREAALRVIQIANVAAACVDPGREFEVHIPGELVEKLAGSLLARGERRRAYNLLARVQYQSNVQGCNCIFLTGESAYKLAGDCK